MAIDALPRPPAEVRTWAGASRLGSAGVAMLFYGCASAVTPAFPSVVDARAPDVVDAVVPDVSVDAAAHARIVQLSVGTFSMCGVDESGHVWCWGGGGDGEIGIAIPGGPVGPTLVPGVVDALEAAADVDNGFRCVARRNGAVTCWGNNLYGQLGSTGHPAPGVHVDVPGVGSVTQVACGSQHACALSSDGSVTCWGDNSHWQVGLRSVQATYVPPTRVAGIANATAITAGAKHSCALISDGSLLCWGLNSEGELGRGTVDDGTVSPEPVVGLSRVTSVSAGSYHTCAVVSTGSVYCWGEAQDDSGVLGHTGLSVSRTPVLVPGIVGAVSVGCGDGHCCALDRTGGVSCWGLNDRGQLGVGFTSPAEPTPMRALLPVPASSLAVRGVGACVLDSMARVFCWGSATDGAAGGGGGGDGTTPMQIAGL